MSSSEDHQENHSEDENGDPSHTNSSDNEDNDQISKPEDDDEPKGDNSDKGTLEAAGGSVIGKLLGENDDDKNDDENDSENDDDTDSVLEDTSDKEKDDEKEDNNNDKDNGNDDNYIEKDNEKEDNSKKEDSDKEKNDGNADSDYDKESEKADSENEKEKTDSDTNSDKEENSDKEDSSDKEDETDSTENDPNDAEFSDDDQVEVLVDKQEEDSDTQINDNEYESENDGNHLSGTRDNSYRNDNNGKKSSSMMITEITNPIEPQDKPKASTGRHYKTQQEQLPSFTDEEILEQINDMMKHKTLPEEKYHQPIRNYVSRQQFRAAQNGDYKKAEELEEYLDMLTSLLNQDDSENKEKIRQEKINEKIKMVNAQHEQFLEKWNKEREKKLNDQENSRLAMEKRHQDELDEFEAECNKQGFIQRYNKPSQNLLNLRKAENQFAMAKKFDDAKNIKKKADNLQLLETEEAKKKINDAVTIKLQAIEERQEREKECQEQHNRAILEAHDRKKEKQQLAYDKAMSNLYSQLAPPTNKDKMETLKPEATKRPIRNTVKCTRVKPAPTLDIPTINISNFKKQKKIIKPKQQNNATRRKDKK